MHLSATALHPWVMTFLLKPCDISQVMVHNAWTFPGGSDGKASVYNVGDLGLSLGWEDPLQKKKATHSSILTWRIPWIV